MPFIFYDVETTGTRTSFDQILQFAAIKTDDEFNILDTFDVRCRLLPYIVPAPGTLLVTGVTVADITTCPLSHFEMMRQVHAKMYEWSQGGAVFVGWNSMRFDETMLRQAYYQSLLPVYQTNTNGNGRADIMRMAQVVSACTLNTLAIPLQADGKRARTCARSACRYQRYTRRCQIDQTARSCNVGRANKPHSKDDMRNNTNPY